MAYEASVTPVSLKARKTAAKAKKIGENEGESVCVDLSQLAETARLATPLARFGKSVRGASKQRVGSSSLPGRAISLT